MIPTRRFAFDPGKAPQEGVPTCERSLSWTSVVQGLGLSAVLSHLCGGLGNKWEAPSDMRPVLRGSVYCLSRGGRGGEVAPGTTRTSLGASSYESSVCPPTVRPTCPQRRVASGTHSPGFPCLILIFGPLLSILPRTLLDHQ